MAITPVEIRNQKFKKGIGGYSEQEVNRFLLAVADDYEQLYQENAELKETVKRFEFELAKYRKMEETLNQSLIVAQQTAEEIVANARRQTEAMFGEARKRISDIFVVYEDILKRLGVFKSEIKAYLVSQMELLEKNEKRIDELTEFFYRRDMKDALEGLSRVKGDE